MACGVHASVVGPEAPSPPTGSNIIKTSDLGALEGLDKYGRAFSKNFPVKSIVESAMDCSHGIELGSRARLGTRPSGTWVVYTHPVATA